MRAAATIAPGGPVEIREMAVPPPRPGEILVRVEAVTLTGLDRAVFDGAGVGEAAMFPLVQGMAVAGTVETGGVAFQPGMRVIVEPAIPCRRCGACRSRRGADCRSLTWIGIHRQGGLAELVSVPRANLTGVPAGVSLPQAAGAHTHSTVRQALAEAGLEATDTVLVTATGGAGAPAAIQMAAAQRARVLVVVATETAADRVRSLGGEPLPGQGRELVDRLREATDGKGADVVVDDRGDPDVLPAALEGLAPGGRVVTTGNREGSGIDVDLSRLHRLRQRIIGTGWSPDRDVRGAFRMMLDHGIEPVISSVHSLAHAGDAMEAMTDPTRVGEVVVRVAR